MRLLITAIACLFAFSFTSYAQDILITNKGEEILVKAIEVSHDDIKYKKYSNLEGPIYTVLKSELFMIKYQNGEKDVFEDIENQIQNMDYSKDLDIEEIYYDGNTISSTVQTKYYGAAIATVGLIVSSSSNEPILGSILTASGSVIFFISEIIQDFKTAALGNAVSKLYDIENKRLNHIKNNSQVFEEENRGDIAKENDGSQPASLNRLGPLGLKKNQKLIYTVKEGVEYQGYVIYFSQTNHYYWIQYTNAKGKVKRKAIYQASFDKIKPILE